MSRTLAFASLLILSACTGSCNRKIVTRTLPDATQKVFDTTMAPRSLQYPGLSRMAKQPVQSASDALAAARKLYPKKAARIACQASHGRFFVFSVEEKGATRCGFTTVLYGVKGHTAIYLYHTVP